MIHIVKCDIGQSLAARRTRDLQVDLQAAFDLDLVYVKFGLNEFSSKTACVAPQNSPIDDWMSLPV